MPTGVVKSNAEDAQSLEQLRLKLTNRKYTGLIQVADYPTPPPDGPMSGVGIVLKDIAADDLRLKPAIKHVTKCLKAWLPERYRTNPELPPLRITIWSKDARTSKDIYSTREAPYQDITPAPPTPASPTPVKLVGLWDTLRGFTWLTRIFLTASLVSGIALTAYLWVTDADIDVWVGSHDLKRPQSLLPYNHEWLNSHAYIPNVLAAATGFLIGAPFALIVLATFTVQREERAALERVNKLSVLAWDKFKDSVYDLCNDRRQRGLDLDAYLVRFVHDQILSEYQKYISLAQTYRKDERTYRGTTDAEIAELQSFLTERSNLMQKQIYAGFETIGTQYWLQIKWSIIRTNWNTLNQYVRLQRLERSLAWFGDEPDAEFMNRLSDQKHPMTAFMELHELDHSTTSASMSAALAAAQKDARGPGENLKNKLLASTYPYGTDDPASHTYRDEFGYTSVKGHAQAAQDARLALQDLRRVVDDVEREGWPRKHTRPVEPR